MSKSRQRTSEILILEAFEGGGSISHTEVDSAELESKVDHNRKKLKELVEDGTATQRADGWIQVPEDAAKCEDLGLDSFSSQTSSSTTVFFGGNTKYAEGWERIFGNKDKN